MLAIRAGTLKILSRIANREDPDQTDLGLNSLFVPFWQAISVQHFLNIYCSLIFRNKMLVIRAGI